MNAQPEQMAQSVTLAFDRPVPAAEVSRLIQLAPENMWAPMPLGAQETVDRFIADALAIGDSRPELRYHLGDILKRAAFALTMSHITEIVEPAAGESTE